MGTNDPGNTSTVHAWRLNQIVQRFARALNNITYVSVMAIEMFDSHNCFLDFTNELHGSQIRKTNECLQSIANCCLQRRQQQQQQHQNGNNLRLCRHFIQARSCFIVIRAQSFHVLCMFVCVSESSIRTLVITAENLVYVCS